MILRVDGICSTQCTPPPAHATPNATLYFRILILTEFKARVRQLIRSLKDAASGGDYSSDLVIEDEIEIFGQFPLSLAIVEEILGLDPTEADVDSFSLHGYSQGGTRAQLVSMYYAFVHELRFRTVTFGSTGSQCFTYEGKSMGESTDTWRDLVDPSDDHSDHIVGFYDALDPYAVLDYNVGMRCKWGTTGIETRRAFNYCDKVIGVGLDVLGALSGDELRRCTYQVHGPAWLAMSTDPSSSSSLFSADGIPDGSCSVEPIVSEDGDECQANGDPYDFVLFALFFIAIPSFVVLLLLLCTVRAVCLGCGDCVACLGWLCCCCCGGGQGKKVTRCGCYEVHEDASMLPSLLCLCNAGPSHQVKDNELGGMCSPPENDAWCCNRFCCCCGRPCTYCGIPCCPPG